MARGDRDDRIMRRGVRLLWLSVRAQRGPFSLAVVGAALFAVMAVGGTIVLGRVTDDVLTPAFEEGGVERSAVALGRRGHHHGVPVPHGGRGAAPLLRADGATPDAGASGSGG